MKRQILALLAIFTFGTFLFTSCETDDAVITLKGDNPAVFDLGQDFVEPGFEVEGGNEDDVEVAWSPAYNKNVVQEYIATYSLETASSVERKVHVSSKLLAGTYNVSDTGLANDYQNTVTQSTEVFNRLIISNFLDFETAITVTAIVDGTSITVPKHTPSGWGAGETVEATGSYNGETKTLTTFEYTIIEIFDGETVESTGTLTFTKL